jgi:hypothetical protein
MPTDTSPRRSQSRGRLSQTSHIGKSSNRAMTAPSRKVSNKINGKVGANYHDEGGNINSGIGNIVLDTNGSVVEPLGFDRRGSIDTHDISALSVSSAEDLRGFNLGMGINVLSGSKNGQLEKALREAYSVAQAKAEEFRRLDNSATIQTSGNLTGIVQVKQAQRIYAAVSTLLYGTLSMTKISSLEKFIVSKSAMVPVAIFDSEDWGTILQAAKNYRLSVSYEVQKLLEGRDSVVTTASREPTQPTPAEDTSSSNISGDNSQNKDDNGTRYEREVLAMQSKLKEAHKSKVDTEHLLQKVTVALEAAEKRCKDLEVEKSDIEDTLKATSKITAKKPHQPEIKPASSSGSHDLTKENEKLVALVESMKKQMKDMEQSRESELGSVAALEQKLQESLLTMSKLESEKAQCEEESQKLKEKIESLEISATSSATKVQESVIADQQVVQLLRNDMEETKDKLRAAEEAKQELHDRVAESQRRNESLEQALETTKKELAVAVSTIIALKEAASAAAEAAEKDAAVAASSGEQSTESLQALVKQANLKVGSLEAEVKETEAKYTIVSEKMSKLVAHLEVVREQSETAKKDLKVLEQSSQTKEAELLKKIETVKGYLDKAQKDLSITQETLQLERKKHQEDSALLIAKIAAQDENSSALSSTIKRLEEETKAQKEKYKTEMSRLKNSSVEAAKLISESKLRDEVEASKKELDLKLKQSQAEWEEERDRFEGIINEMRLAKDKNTKGNDNPSAPTLVEDQKVAGLHVEVDRLNREIKAAQTKAEDSAKEWKTKVDSAQKQVADLRKRLANATRAAGDTPSGDKERQQSEQSRTRAIGSMLIKSPAKRDRLPVDNDGSTFHGIEGKLNAVKKIQAAMRGSLVRERLWRTANTIAAKQKGVLVAINGTHQGETGWYMKVIEGNVPQYFYFILDRGDFVMLCGPLAENQFQEALFHDRDRRKNDQIKLSRSAVEGAQGQLEHLAYLNNVKGKDVVDIQNDLYTIRVDSEKREQALKKTFDKRIEKERNASEKHSRKCMKLQESLHDLEEENEKLRVKVQQKVEVVNEWSKFVDDAKALINSRDERLLIRAQSVIRSFLTRRKLRRAAVALAAKKKGVMQAIGKTKQGKTGWYLNPGGEIYYYTNRQGLWSKVIGPLSEKQYSLAIKETSKISNKSKIYSIGGLDHEALGKTPFELSREVAANFNGQTQVYLGIKSENVYIAVNAQDIAQRNDGELGRRRRAGSVSFDEFDD